MITNYHSKYIASDQIRRRSSDSSEKLAVAVAGAQVDMNPHQVDAALFAFASPLSKGALLADEVGLGKTIEAGLVISPLAFCVSPQPHVAKAMQSGILSPDSLLG